MPVLQILSTKARSGKSTAAVGLARGLAGHAAAVRLLRCGASAAAHADARSFCEYAFVSASPEPVSREQAQTASAEMVIVELDAGAEPLDAPAIIALSGHPSPDDEALARSLGQKLVGSIATAVAPSEIEAVARELTDALLRPLAVLPEDRRLAAPSVEDIRHALAADVLYEGENLRTAIDNILVAPVYTDGAKAHLRRFAGTTAVLAPSYKTDLLLAAIDGDSSCVIVTGGHQPSHYVVDRVRGQQTTLLLAQPQTPAAVAALSDVWGASAFAGDAKAAAITDLLQPRIDWAALTRKLP